MPASSTQSRHWLSRTLILNLFTLTLLTGCATYKDETEAIRAAWAVGNNSEAARLASNAAQDKEDSVDRVVFLLEEGSAWRSAENYIESNTAFDAAEARMDELANEAVFKVGETITANFTNLSFIPYTGFAYDRIMLHTYKALNEMGMGEMERARVELNRALEAQRNAVRENDKRIAEAQEAARAAAAKSKEDRMVYNAERAERDPRLQGSLDSTYSYLNQYRAYSDYVNPFAVWLDGLFFMARSTGLSDLERARKSFERVRGMVNDTAYIDEDLQTVNRLQSGLAIEPVTYVIFETGMAPSRQEERIDIPLFIVSREVPYVGVAFPKLVFNSSYIPGLTVKASNGQWETQQVCNMDSVVAQEFKNELPIIITRTLISAGSKALAQYALYDAAKDSGTLGTFVIIAGTIYQAAMNQADLRTWITLPKQFQIARLRTPEDRRLSLIPRSTPGSIEVNLQPGLINVVYVKSNTAADPPNATQFVLKQDSSFETQMLIQ